MLIRGIRATIPIKTDQAVSRRRKGSKGGRPPAFDATRSKQRHAVEAWDRLIVAVNQAGSSSHGT